MHDQADLLRAGLAEISRQLRAETLDLADDRSAPHGAAGLGELRAVLAQMPGSAWPRLATAFNDDQVASKLWLIEQLERVTDLAEHRVVILGAWFGVLALLMHRVMPRPPAELVCIDIDPAACELATQLLSLVSPRPEVRLADMMELDHAQLSSGRDTVFINTSCEHLTDFARWRRRVPSGAWLVVQSNNHEGCREHVNCVADLDAFDVQVQLSRTLFRGALPLKQFQRFMLIGHA